MANTKWRMSMIAAGPHPWRRQIHCGWIDAQNGVAWSPVYERMSKSEQMGYEQGRLLVREAMAEGFGLPIWCGDKAGCGPVDDLWTNVCAKLGRSVCP